MNLTIHGKASVEFDDKMSWKQDYINMLGDMMEYSPLEKGNRQTVPRLRILSEPTMDTRGLRSIENGASVSRTALFDDQYKVLIENDLNRNLVTMTSDRPCLEWFQWFVHLLLLKAGIALTHAACVAKDGQAVVIASWGGVGKTALVAKFVRDFGWGVMSDDLVGVSAEGTCFSYPKPMVLYPYHRNIFPELFSEGRGPNAPIWLNPVFSKMIPSIKGLLRKYPLLLQAARNSNPQSVRIKPSEVFGTDKLVSTASLNTIIWLDRVKGISKPEFCSDDGTLVSRIFGSTVREYDSRCVNLTNVAMGIGLVHFDDYIGQWQQILVSALSGAKKHLIYVPESTPIEQLPFMIRDFLAKQGLV